MNGEGGDANKKQKKTIVLAFDIERSGGRAKDETFAIGASVVDEDGSELDSLCLKGYFPEHTKFEKRCWDEFWSKNEEMLKTLEFDRADELAPHSNSKTKHNCWPQWAIGEFHDFRKKWEKEAKERGWSLELASDNKVYDGGYINLLIEEYLMDPFCEEVDKVMPLPYSASDDPPAYKKFRETHSEQRGVLFVIDPTLEKGRSCSARIEELYNCAGIKCVHEHDHNPAHDAYSIAREAQILNAIRDGRVALHTTKEKAAKRACVMEAGEKLTVEEGEVLASE